MSSKFKHQKSTYIANGKHFKSLQAVEDYAREHKCRISNTETIAKGVHLITLTGIGNENEE